MLKRLLRKILVTLLIGLLSGLLYFASDFEIPIIDQKSEAYFTAGLKSSTLAYATTRGVNAVVSVLQWSEINVSPAGVGVTIAAGQILDPLKDMAERLSDIIVTAVVSIGMQKIAFDIGEAYTFKAVSILLLLFLPAIWLNFRAPSIYMQILVRACYFMLMLRFLLPATSLVNEYLYENLFKVEIERSIDKLSVISSDYDELSEIEAKKKKGMFPFLTGDDGLTVDKLKQVWRKVTDNAEEIMTSLMALTTLYLTMFIIQILLIPLGMLWLLMKFTAYSGLDLIANRLLNSMEGVSRPKNKDFEISYLSD